MVFFGFSQFKYSLSNLDFANPDAITWASIGKELSQISENKVTIEGANASKIVNNVALKKGLEMPIINMTYKVVHENYNPVDAIKEFMSRNPSKERN